MESQIIKEFKKLKKDISPRPEWVSLSRDILLQQINPRKQYQAAEVGLAGYAQLFSQVFRQHIVEPAVIMLLVLGVFLGSSFTINAAFYSLPGDNLYPIKIALEKTHVALVSDQAKKIELKIEFAQKRVAEFDKIVSQVNVSPEQKKKQIVAVVKEFKNNVVAVNDQLNKINQSTNQSNGNARALTVRIATVVSSQTEELARSFDEKVEELGEVEKLEFEDIVAEAAESIQATNLSAQQLIEDINFSAETDEVTAERVAEEEGAIGQEIDAVAIDSSDTGDPATSETSDNQPEDGIEDGTEVTTQSTSDETADLETTAELIE